MPQISQIFQKLEINHLILHFFIFEYPILLGNMPHKIFTFRWLVDFKRHAQIPNNDSWGSNPQIYDYQFSALTAISQHTRTKIQMSSSNWTKIQLSSGPDLLTVGYRVRCLIHASALRFKGGQKS